MKIISLIPKEKRKLYRCNFCDIEGSTYVIEVEDKTLDMDKPIRCCCCSQCLDLFGLDEDTKEKQLAAREVTIEVVTRTVVTVLANNAREAKQKAFECFQTQDAYCIDAEILDVQLISEVK